MHVYSAKLIARGKMRSIASKWFMIYVLMYPWLMRERCTYPNHYVALRNQRPIAGVGDIDYIATFPEIRRVMAVPIK